MNTGFDSYKNLSVLFDREVFCRGRNIKTFHNRVNMAGLTLSFYYVTIHGCVKNEMRKNNDYSIRSELSVWRTASF